MKVCCTYAKLNISECLVAFNGIAPNRIGQMMKRLVRAAVMDSWDWDEGNEELTSGDKIFIPRNEFEKNLWMSLRNQQKEDFKKLVNTRKGGEATKHKFAPAKPEQPKPAQPKPDDRQQKLAQIQDMVGKIGHQYDSRQDTMMIYHDSDMAQMRGEFGDFLRRTFTPNALKSLSAWCIKNYLGRGIKIETVLKVGCRIANKEFNEVWYQYINSCN